MVTASAKDSRQGLLFGVGAYGIWGAFPLYWPLLEPAGAIEILAHRILWSLVTMGLLVVIFRRSTQLRAVLRNPRTLLFLTLAAVTISTNWAVYIWAVNNEHVVEAALGYYVNPLVTVLIGVVVLGERLRRIQVSALGLASVAVVVLTVAYGRPPWVALVLACSFGTYGLAKKKANVGAVESLAFETAVVAPVAAGYLGLLAWQGDGNFVAHGTGHALLLTTAGIVTAVPLICFGAAATRLPLVTLGLLQYLTPTIQFGLGVFLFHEAMPTGRWFGFALVWIALIMFTAESISHRRRQLRLAVEASAI